jgi:hypothetical protein
MEVVIAGDIIGSKKNEPESFLNIIENVLKKYSNDGRFIIYRGDSFQAWINEPHLALYCAVELKAALKKSALLDVRIAIGLGEVELIDNNIAKSTGSALTYSGELLDVLKSKEQEIMVKSSDAYIDQYMNMILKMALLYMNNWTENGAETVYEMLKTPQITQQELGEKLGVKQATASRRLNRANWNETLELLSIFKKYYKDVSHGNTH